MPKIENWTRQDSVERELQPYIWANDDKDVIAKVLDRGDSYEAMAKVISTGWVIYCKEGIDSKEEARQHLVDWMKENPAPRTKNDWYLLERDEELDLEEQTGDENIVKAYHHPVKGKYLVMREGSRGFFVQLYDERGDLIDTLESPPIGGGGAKARMERYISENP